MTKHFIDKRYNRNLMSNGSKSFRHYIQINYINNYKFVVRIDHFTILHFVNLFLCNALFDILY